jgi:prepilin peptidase CpaA
MSQMQHLPLIAGAALSGGAMVLAAASDLRRYLIPNRLCLAVAAGYGLAAATLPPATWLSGLAVGAAVFAAGALLFARGWLGGGDVKLGAAVALWAGPAFFSDFALATALAGAAVAAVMLSPARRLMPAAPGAELLSGLRQPMPFGVALAAGGLWVLRLQLT